MTARDDDQRIIAYVDCFRCQGEGCAICRGTGEVRVDMSDALGATAAKERYGDDA
jgi:hypothetical protein